MYLREWTHMQRRGNYAACFQNVHCRRDVCNIHGEALNYFMRKNIAVNMLILFEDVERQETCI